MPFLLRTIRKSRWYSEGKPYIAPSEASADALIDLKTDDDALSVFHIEDDRSNLERVITALAANRDRISNLDYALFAYHLLEEIDVQSKITAGESPDIAVNTFWHRDLVEFSALKLATLANAMLTRAQKVRVPERRIKELLFSALTNGQIEKSKIDPRITSMIDAH